VCISVSVWGGAQCSLGNESVSVISSDGEKRSSSSVSANT